MEHLAGLGHMNLFTSMNTDLQDVHSWDDLVEVEVEGLEQCRAPCSAINLQVQQTLVAAPASFFTIERERENFTLLCVCSGRMTVNPKVLNFPNHLCGIHLEDGVKGGSYPGLVLHQVCQDFVAVHYQ